jgi:hypothetical protein
MERRRRIVCLTALFLLFTARAGSADTYTVANSNATGPGSLAQAILDSNAHGGQDTIAFNISGQGPYRIVLSGAPALPEITDSLIIDGYTQPGAHPNTRAVGDDAVILIHLDGGATQTNGLTISAGNCVVRGLSITGFTVNPNPDPLGAPTGGFGIFLKGPGNGNVVEGNFLGLKPDGITPGRNFNGVRAFAAPQIIGGSNVAMRNVISGNTIGVGLYSGSGTGMVVSGNYIGTDASGTAAVANDLAIAVGATDAIIGGSTPLAGNLISGNKSGISLGASFAYHITGPGDRALIQGNLIGTTADGTGALGNNGDGIYMIRGSDSTIGGLEAGAGNTIANNDDGIIVHGTGVSILSNSIYGNRGRGIILDGATSNNGQAAPVITSEHFANGIATVSGTLQSAANTQFRVQLFADSQSLTSSKQTFIGSISVVTNGSGQGSFTVSFPFADSNVVFNATATAPTAPNGSTSEFSRNAAYLQNLSARAAVATGGDALIGGIIIPTPGEIAVRGIGPSLKAFGIADALADPTLEFHAPAGAEKFNDNWKDDPNQAALQQAGLAPSDELESALMPFTGSTALGFNPDLPPQYTAVLRGKGDTTGIGVVEVYGLAASFDPDFFAKVANLSARGLVGSGENVIVGGFIVGGGNASTRVVVRAIGPSLASSGVTNPLPDPLLELHDNNGSTINSNDNWEQSQADDLQTVGLAPTNAAESAILTRLLPGAYTAVVQGKNNATGVALVEIYRLP